MIVYRDILSGDEVCSDAFPFSEVEDGMIYEFVGKKITIDAVNVDTGANASQEEQEEGADDQAAQVINVVYSCKLQETQFDKKSYMAYIKGYMKAMAEKLASTNPSRVDAFKAGAQAVVKKILGDFDNYFFYLGESMDPEGLVVLMYYKDGEDIPRFWVFKDGVKAEKV